MRRNLLASTLLLCSCAPGDAGSANAEQASLSAYFDCIDEEGLTLVAAHRGTDGRAAENALSSIRSVTARTAGLVEVDVAASADGVLFLHHDDTLDRSTTGTGSAEIPWSNLRTLSLRDAAGRVTAEPVTSLAALLDWVRDEPVILELDLKPSARYADVAALLEEKGVEDKVVVIAYTQAQARAIADAFPEAVISAGVDSLADLDALMAAGIPASRLLAWTGTEAPDPALYEALDARGVEVIFGTLGGRDSWDARIARSGNDDAYVKLAEQGVDILATDRPIEAHEILAETGRAGAGQACRAFLP